MRNFINLADIDKRELRKIIDHTKSLKEKGSTKDLNTPLTSKTLIMIFEKPSTRTRLSFESAMQKLGGHVLVLYLKESHYGSKDESIYDTAKVLSQYGDIVMMRTGKHEHFLEFSKHLEIPIINGLTNLSHPCQVMADVLTFEELRGPITNKKIAWLGDGNNVVYSLIEAATQFNFQLAIACPKKFEPNKKVIKWANIKKANIFITRDPKEVAKDADAIMTDKPISMGDINVNKKQKKQLLKSYQVNKKIMKLAKKDAIFMHCLPASRGEEVTNEVMDGKQSAVWLEALNRMHVQKSVIQWCLKLL
tara:strand:- start:397 stop:1314 length:918 start_codon:yes stop_codon:yes gene_type:complete